MLRQASPAYACRSCRTLGVFVPRMRKLPCRPCGSTLGRPLVACVAFGWSRLLQLLTFISFVIPLAVAYLATELSRAYGLWSTSFTAVIALLEASFAYVSCVFAIADPRVLQFGRTLIDFTLSSLAGWAVVSVVSLASALAVPPLRCVHVLGKRHVPCDH